jgi:DNA replication and repair protein RecF
MLSRLAVSDFRNIEAAELELGSTEIFFEGENGQGKTNMLEAVYFLCYASSFRICVETDLIRSGAERYLLEGNFENGNSGGGECVSISIDKQKKTAKVDGKQIRDRRELMEMHPCVVFSHDDMEFSSGSPERRRWFFDQTISLASPLYIDALRNYKKILKTRNFCLRERNFDLLDAFDEQLAHYGIELMRARENAMASFSSIFSDTYAHVSQLGYPVSISYRPSWKSMDREETRKELAGRRAVDADNGLTMTGPHRDRFAFMANSRSFSHIASTGQLRLLSLVLRSCQTRYFSDRTGKKPIILIDDVLLELDPQRRKRFMDTIPAYEQSFSAFLPGEPYDLYRRDSTIVYHVDSGHYELRN